MRKIQLDFRILWDYITGLHCVFGFGFGFLISHLICSKQEKQQTEQQQQQLRLSVDEQSEFKKNSETCSSTFTAANLCGFINSQVIGKSENLCSIFNMFFFNF